MKTMATVLGMIILLPACAVHHSSPSGSVTAVYRPAQWHEVREVIWAEHYDCDRQTIAYIHTQDDIHDEDMLVLLHCSRYSGVALPQVVAYYRHHHHSLIEVIHHYRLPMDALYINVAYGTRMPAIYADCYRHYRPGRLAIGIHLTNAQVRALISLRIGHFYFGYSPHQYFIRYDTYHDHHHPFRRFAVVYADYCGRGGRTWRGRKIHRVVHRPWRRDRHRDHPVNDRQPPSPDRDRTARGNNGHGNNADRVDSSNPGRSHRGRDTDPTVDDENRP
ncbi:MAG: hypothetical protein R3236_11765, partial [Phycisphaeraceae bacterium]|nr:hypothetical protein [Phycisphaeraceae bacterium]